jgi:hypothetical protein
MMKYPLTIAALVLALSSSAAMSEPKPPTTVAELNAGMAAHGCKQQLITDEDEATLLVTCAQDVVARDKNLRTWFFSDNITDTWINGHKAYATALFIEYEVATSVLVYYKTTDIDHLAVIGRLMGRDDYGQPVDKIALLYGFSREIYQKVDPVHINWKSVRKIAKDPVAAFESWVEAN